jgi:hypothetical protein
VRTVTAAHGRGRAALTAALTNLSNGERDDLRNALLTLNHLSEILRGQRPAI